VIVIAHDWGSIWGGYLQQLYPELVEKAVYLDVSPPLLTTPSIFMFPYFFVLGIYYQYWLILAWILTISIPFIGPMLGNFLFRYQVRRLRKSKITDLPGNSEQLSAFCCYPYFYFQLNYFTGLLRLRRIRSQEKSCPTLFLWGSKKAFQFHSKKWVELLNETPGSCSKSYEGGHWFYVECAKEVNEDIEAWLEKNSRL
jgi:cis-3-alkyl-4-acyloxetan-2-one decarboxylase